MDFSGLKRAFYCLLFWISAVTGNTQVYIVKSIRNFGAKGNGKSDDQFAFEKAASFFNSRGGNGKLVLPKGIYIVGRQDFRTGIKQRHVLNILNCKNLTIEGEGAVVKFKDSLLYGAFDPVLLKPFHSDQRVFVDYAYAAPIGNFINLLNCSHIVIKNIEVNGNQKGMVLGGTYGDTGFQLSHDGILLEDCSNVLLQNLHIHHMGRDGVQIGNRTPAKWLTQNQNIEIRNSRFEFNGRQGLSWVGGSGLKVKSSKFNSTGKGRFLSAPGAGLDIEAEIGIIQNGFFEDCEFIDNVGCAIVADNGDSKNMTFVRCTFWGVNGWTAWINKPNYNFIESNFYGSIVHGYDSESDENATKFFRCKFEDKSYHAASAYGNYLVEINGVRRILFDRCDFTANKKKLIWVVGDSRWNENEMPVFRKCIFNVKRVANDLPDFWTRQFKVRFIDDTWYLPMSFKETNYYTSGGENILIGENYFHYTDTVKKIN
jgi:hypothetical protein